MPRYGRNRWGGWGDVIVLAALLGIYLLFSNVDY